MKKLYSLILAVVAVVAISSCSKDEFKDKYVDPSKTTTVSCEKLMTGAFMFGRDYTFNAYWRMYTWDNYFGKLAQSIGTGTNSGSMYYINDGYASDRWKSFYRVLRNYRVMQANATENDRIYLALTEVFLYDHLSQIVDIFGPVPFEEAGKLPETGSIAASLAKFDSDVDLYRMMLTNLDALYTEIGTLASNLTPEAETALPKQDFINGGNLEMWQRYANALLLRLGMHVAIQGSLTAEGRAAVSKAAGRLLPTNWENSIKVKSDFDGFNYWENFRDSWKDINATASQGVIDAFRVSGADDPRLRVVYIPNEAGEYFGEGYHETAQEQSDHNTYDGYANRYYARLNYATFTYNNLFVSPVFSAAEAWFLLAEAIERGYASGNSETAFKNAIAASIEQYFDENVHGSQDKATSSGGEYFLKLTEADIPSNSDALAFAGNVWNAYTNKIEGIMTQKWAHFGITQPTQAWTDIRRTGYPHLNYPTDTGSGVKYANIVNRVKYPNDEVEHNKANYEANKGNVGDDSAEFPLFWANKL
ncbi:MAG: SusD/RagB family nutrient-binding outer membrane lipoprotein [Bacteroidales bacterium]|nr:SusD/RagB family nutrient-binding outer membrane lipoprotein [Bacteroidales bacterium]